MSLAASSANAPDSKICSTRIRVPSATRWRRGTSSGPAVGANERPRYLSPHRAFDESNRTISGDAFASRSRPSLARDLAVEEIADQRHHLVGFVFQSKVSGVEEVKLHIGQIALVRMCALGRKDLVVLAPHQQRRRPVLTKISLHRGIERQIGAVVVEQV